MFVLNTVLRQHFGASFRPKGGRYQSSEGTLFIDIFKVLTLFVMISLAEDADIKNPFPNQSPKKRSKSHLVF